MKVGLIMHQKIQVAIIVSETSVACNCMLPFAVIKPGILILVALMTTGIYYY